MGYEGKGGSVGRMDFWLTDSRKALRRSRLRVGKGHATFGMRIRHLRAAVEQTVMDRRGVIQGDICAGYAFGASAYMEWIEYLNSLDWMRSLWRCVGRVEDLGQSPGAR